ncbi:MAG: OB-fold nucleic acid binding domain-containing protein [Nanoarchaeota archaeon]|nr:OB-fold nucleic acid binding domain-containing protein [Nanoarchaeota archaeon]
MKESDLFKIALVCSLVGIFLILFIVQKYEVPNYNIDKIDKSMLNEMVGVKGQINKITETPGLYIINLEDSTGEITVVVFKEEELDILEGNFIEIEGEVAEYKNEVEIIAKQIKVLNVN